MGRPSLTRPPRPRPGAGPRRVEVECGDVGEAVPPIAGTRLLSAAVSMAGPLDVVRAGVPLKAEDLRVEGTGLPQDSPIRGPIVCGVPAAANAALTSSRPRSTVGVGGADRIASVSYSSAR